MGTGRRNARSGEGDLAELRPIRRAEWQEVEGRVVVERPRPRRRGISGLLHQVSYLTGVRRIRLDELGSFTWRRLDGRASVADLCRAMREEYGESSEPVEERLRLFLRYLESQELIGYHDSD